MTSPPATRTGHGVGPSRAPHLSCYDHIHRIIPCHRVPVEAEPPAAAAWAVGAGQHLAAIHHLYVVGLHIEVVIDRDKSRLFAEIVLVASHALAPRIARPVARQHAGRRPVGGRGGGLLLLWWW